MSGAPRPTRDTAGSPSLPQPTLRRDDTGTEVELLQSLQSFWRYYGKRRDGEFCPMTETAVKAWQADLQRYNCGAVDGIDGPRTHAAAALFYADVDRFKAAA